MPEESAETIQRQGIPLRISEYRFLLLSGTLSAAEQSDIVSKLVDASIELDNAHVYAEAVSTFGFMGDDGVVEGMRARNTAKLAKVEAEIMDAKENLGEEEVRQSMFVKATILAESGDTKAAISVFDEIEAQKKTTTGQKVDIAFSKLRIAFAADDLPLMSKTIEKAKEYVKPFPHCIIVTLWSCTWRLGGIGSAAIVSRCMKPCSSRAPATSRRCSILKSFDAYTAL
jgi:hypothetical protein